MDSSTASQLESSLVVFENDCSSVTALATALHTSSTYSPLTMLLMSPSVCAAEELDPFSLEDADYFSDSVDVNPFHSTPVKKRKLISDFGIEADRPKCCEENCHKKISAVQFSKAQTIFHHKNRSEQQQFLLDSTLLFGSSTPIIDSRHQRRMIEGIAVCDFTFCKVLGISIKRLRQSQSLYQNGVTKATRKMYFRPELNKSSEAKTWMRGYFHLVGDRMPHIEKIHLPHFLTKKDVYDRMRREFVDHGIQERNVVSLKTFYKFWKRNFSDVLIPEQSRFSKCDICTKFHQERTKSGGRCGFTDEYAHHLDIVEKERRKYYRHREKARAHPDKCITIIIDGMDQSKTNLPRLTQTPKSAQNLQQLRTHISAALVHTRSPDGKLAYAFIDMLQYPHNCNLTLHVLLSILKEMKDKLPPILNLQLDNTARENKNRFVFGFCALLVAKKVFRKVRVNFLPVGHTHEDIDQLFSRISRQLNQSGAETLPELQAQISVSSTPSPNVSIIEGMFDIRSWILPYLEGLHGHSGPHCFKFVTDQSLGVCLFYKNWSSDAWCQNEDALTILKTTSIPGIPDLVHPTDTKVDLLRLKDDIPKYRQWVKEEAALWWEQLDIESVYTELKDCGEWALSEFQEGPPLEEQPRVLEPNQDLAALFNAEAQPCNVYVGPYRSTQVQAVQDLSNICVGQLVAVFNDDEATEPWIGKLEEIHDDNVTVEWMEGSYKKRWKPAFTQDEANKRKKKPWIDIIPKSSIILYAFELTATGNLRKVTVQHLQTVYKEKRLQTRS